MSGRAVAGWGAAVTVVLAAASGALINELHEGWPWWLAAGLVVLLGAVLSAWLALRTPAKSGDRLGAGATKVTGEVGGDVITEVHGAAATASPGTAPSDGDQLGPGAVLVDGNIRGGVRTTIKSDPPQQPSS